MSVLSDLEKLHAAEDFFSYLKVDFDPALLRVARLHILKRMGTYLGEKDFSGPNEEAIFVSARETLVQAYQDFTNSTPIEQRVFKGAAGARPKPPETRGASPEAFLPLDALGIDPARSRLEPALYSIKSG